MDLIKSERVSKSWRNLIIEHLQGKITVYYYYYIIAPISQRGRQQPRATILTYVFRFIYFH